MTATARMGQAKARNPGFSAGLPEGWQGAGFGSGAGSKPYSRHRSLSSSQGLTLFSKSSFLHSLAAAVCPRFYVNKSVFLYVGFFQSVCLKKYIYAHAVSCVST